jgi:hypothetical protein
MESTAFTNNVTTFTDASGAADEYIAMVDNLPPGVYEVVVHTVGLKPATYADGTFRVFASNHSKIQ